MAGPPHPLTRAELLGGLSARRISTLLYAVESRTAQLALEARHSTTPAICEPMAADRERAFLSALAAGRTLEAAPRIQALEHYAPLWAHLVPSDAAGRADLARRIGDKYRFRARDVPRLRTALRLDDAAVSAAFEGRHGRPLDTIFQQSLPRRERWHWLWSRLSARLAELPPFWSAFSLTLTQTVGAGVLALPIALAGVGPLPGLVLVVALGLVNVLTAAAVAESFARTGTVRWGGAYFGRVVTQHLGRLAGVVLSFNLAALSLVALLAYYVGLSTTLAIATGVPSGVWAGALFAVTLAFVVRGRLEATVVSALLVGCSNILVIMILSVLALSRLEIANLTFVAVPFAGGGTFDPAILGLVFGVVLLAFFGHTAVANGARMVLRQDPSGRSLVRGTAAGMLTAIALYAVWNIAVGSAVDRNRLAVESGTALAPLAEVVGPAVLVVGTVFVVLAMGMAAVHFSLGLHFQASELLGRTRRAARLAGFIPLIGVFAAVEWLLITGRESFTGALGVIGTLAAPMMAGIFPILLLAATRRRGDYVPAGTAAWRGHPGVLGLVYALFLAAVIAHGAFIWQAPFQRLAAFVTAIVVTAATVWVVRSGAFQPLATVEVRRDRERARLTLRLIAGGRRQRADARVRQDDAWRNVALEGSVELPEQVTAMTLDLAPVEARQLAVWTHEVDPAGASAPLPAHVSLRAAGQVTRLDPVHGRVSAPLDARDAVLEVRLADETGRRGNPVVRG